MNGLSTGNYAYDGAMPPPLQTSGSGRRQMMEGYRKDVLNGLASDQRYNAVSCTAQLVRIRSGQITNAMPCSQPQKDHWPPQTSI